MKEYCVVMTTFENEQKAQPLIDTILEKKLAACVQVININSHYSWNNSICHDKEVLVLFKTKTALYESLQQIIMSGHPYETPEILQLPVLNGLQKYLKWIDEVTC